MGPRWLKQLAPRLSYRKPHRLLRESLALELALMVVVLAITGFLSVAPRFQTVVLNLYFLPVAVCGLYLGRYSAGVMSLLCVLSAAIAIVFHEELASSQLIEVLVLSVWGGVLGLTALVIGTLSDDRRRELAALHESHRTDTLSDALTRVANRRAFEYELTRRLTEWTRRRTPLSLALFDVDHFKKFNDTYGHRAGDAVLCGVAHRLQETIRETDLVARYGGEEFAVIMPSTSLDMAKDVAERARRAVEQSRFKFEGMTLRLTISVGVAQVLPDEEGQSLIERADGALYASKQAGRNCAHVHTGSACEHFGATLLSTLAADAAETCAATQIAPEDAYTDNTTRLPTRKVFVEELKRRLSEIRRYDSTMSLMLVELDAMADPVNRVESVAENVRSVVAEFIRNMMRDSDLVARFGPNRFAVLMPSTPIEGAVIPAERLRVSVANCRSLKHNGLTLKFTVSLGLTASRSGDDAGSILDRAQQALQAANLEGGNRSFLHDGTHYTPVVRTPAILGLAHLPTASASDVVPHA